MMNFLGQLFRGGDKDVAENLITIAYLEGRLTREQVDLINGEMKEVGEINTDLHMGNDELERLRQSLPNTEPGKFKTIFTLIKNFMVKGHLDDQRKGILTSIILVMHNERSRVEELIDCVMGNIKMGNSESDTFGRLEYLLKPRQINFN